MPRRLGSSFQGLVNKWVNVNRENVVFGDEDEYRQQVIVLDDEPATTERPKSTLRKNKDTTKSKSSGRRRHHQLANHDKSQPDKINASPYHVYDDDKSVSSGRTTLTASTHTTHSTLRSAASVASSCSPAPADDESVSSFNKRLKLSNGDAAGLLPPPAVPGVYYDNEFHGRHSVASPPPPAVPEHIPAVPEHVSSGMAKQRPADVPGVYYGVEYGGSSASTAPTPSPAVEQLGAPAILPAPPGLVVVGAPMRQPCVPKISPPQMQMDHRVYYPPQQGPSRGETQVHRMQQPQTSGPPPEIIARQYRNGPPASPQLMSAHPPAHGIPSPARPVGPPPVMHFIHQHPPATPLPAKSSDVQTKEPKREDGAPPVEKDEDSHMEESETSQHALDEPRIQADIVQSSASADNGPSVHFAPDSKEAAMSPESATSEIEAKMDAALVLSALSFTEQGGPKPNKSEAKGKKGLLLRKARSPKESMRNSPGGMISWKAMRAARAADNES